ncbi:MAG: tetratricopeptide repeat protein [Acidimicrobiia bacterium]
MRRGDKEPVRYQDAPLEGPFGPKAARRARPKPANRGRVFDRDEVVEEREPLKARVRRGGKKAAVKRTRAPKPAEKKTRKRVKRTEARDEILKLGGRKGERYYDALMKAAEAYNSERYKDAIRLLTPMAQELPDASSVRELLGLSLYRMGRWGQAKKELEAFADLTNSVDQHPVLMDCARALKRHDDVAVFWEELGSASPGPELVSEGRIVMAGDLADRGRVRDAIVLLEKRGAKPVKAPREYHLRVWYALADLNERAGDVPTARALFERVRKADNGFADVAERLAALG